MGADDRSDGEAPGRRPVAEAAEQALLDPEATLEVIAATRSRARAELEPRDSPIFAAWGLAWIVAYGCTALAVEGPAPLAGVHPALLALVWPVALGGALVFMSAYLRRFTRGRGGVSAEINRRVYLAYAVAFVGAVVLLPMLGVEAPDAAAGEPPVVWEISMTIVFGLVVLYLAEAAFCRDNLLAAAGLWFGVVNAVGALWFIAWYGTLMAVLGGGGFLAVAAVSALRERAALTGSAVGPGRGAV
jgi:hypothetical protein